MQATEDFKATAFKFVQQLALDLSHDKFDLPGFPDVVMRLHQALGNEDSSVADISKLISSEPSLSARLMQLANSAAFNAGRMEVTDPRAAIQRLGFNNVRSTATSFAVTQLQNREWLMPVRKELAVIWRRSNAVAASCCGIAEIVDAVRPDEAMATGLFHQMGNLYLLTRGHKDGIQVKDNPEWDEIVAGWHPTICRAILENWDMPEVITAAVEHQDVIVDGEDDDATEQPSLTRLLSAAKLGDTLQNEPDRAQEGWGELLTDAKINGELYSDLLERSREKIEMISQTIR